MTVLADESAGEREGFFMRQKKRLSGAVHRGQQAGMHFVFHIANGQRAEPARHTA